MSTLFTKESDLPFLFFNKMKNKLEHILTREIAFIGLLLWLQSEA